MKAAAVALSVVIALSTNTSVQAQAAAGQPTGDRFLQGRPSLANSLSGRAKEEYDRGHLLLDDGDYAGALLKFRRAFDLSGDIRLLWNIAACEKNLRHYARALRLVERYRADAGAQMTELHRREVDLLVRTLEGLVSRVRIEVDQPDASVLVDGELRGKTPLQDVLLIDLGEHQIRVTKPGFREVVVTQEMTGGSEIALPIIMTRESSAAALDKPAAAVARLAVRSVAGAAIWIDGQRVGEQPWQGTLSPGAHALRVSAPGMLDEDRQLVLQPGESQTLDISLKEQPSTTSTLLWVGAGVVAASALIVGGYFLIRSSSESTQPYVGSLEPGTVQLSLTRH